MSDEAGRSANIEREAVRQAARAGAPDRYLAALLSPRPAREDLIATAAFLAEVGRVPRLVNEPMMGEIRLQWWRDALAPLARGEATGNPVADAFGRVLVRRRPPLGLVHGVLDAIEAELDAEPVSDEMAFRALQAKREGGAFALALACLEAGRAGERGRVVELAGQAYGVARTLTDLPWALARGRVPLPVDRMAAHGLAAADLLASAPAPGVRVLLASLAGDARRAVVELRGPFSRLPREARTALLPVALVEPYLRVLERTGHDALRQPAEMLPLERVWRLWRAARFARL